MNDRGGVWEEKIKTPGEIVVIGGSRISKLKMDLKTKENFDFLKKHFLKYFRKGDSVLD